MKSTLVLLLIAQMFFNFSIADTRQIIRYGILDVEFLPYQFFENGIHSGPDADVVREVFKRLNHTYRVIYETLPVKRAEHQLRYGDIDITAMFKTPARELYSIFTNAPLHWSMYKIGVIQGNEFPFMKIEDLKGKTFGIMRGNSISLEFDQAVKDGFIKVQQAKTPEDTLRLLQKGRVDAIVGNIHIMKNYANRLNISNQISYLPQPLSPEKPFRFIISKNSKASPALLKKNLDDTLTKMLQDGTFDLIYKKHGLTFEVPISVNKVDTNSPPIIAHPIGDQVYTRRSLFGRILYTRQGKHTEYMGVFAKIDINGPNGSVKKEIKRGEGIEGNAAGEAMKRKLADALLINNSALKGELEAV